MVASNFILVLKNCHVSIGCKMYLLRSPDKVGGKPRGLNTGLNTSALKLTPSTISYGSWRMSPESSISIRTTRLAAKFFTKNSTSNQHSFKNSKFLLWMDEIRSHHFETRNHWLLVFTGEPTFQGFLGGAKWISSIHSMDSFRILNLILSRLTSSQLLQGSLHYTPERMVVSNFILVLKNSHVSNGQHVSFKEPCAVPSDRQSPPGPPPRRSCATVGSGQVAMATSEASGEAPWEESLDRSSAMRRLGV